MVLGILCAFYFCLSLVVYILQLSTLQANLFFHENTLLWFHRPVCCERRRRRRCAAGDAMRAGAPAVADRAPRAPLVANVVVGALKDAITA